MANFAREHMLKYGWKEGKGLGKDENGITEALKPTLKLDNAGIGYTEHANANWWEVLYNKAVQNIKVESCDDKVSLSVIDKNWDPACPKKGSKIKQCEYGNFLKTSILNNGCLMQDASMKSEKEETANEPLHVPLTDEQLYAACSGRTMHATARHGITLSGKLDRIAQQDRILQDIGISGLSQSKTSLGIKNTMTHRKTNVDSEKEESEHEDNREETSSTEIKDTVVRSKSTRKKHKKRIKKLADQLNNCDLKESKKKKINIFVPTYLPSESILKNTSMQGEVDEELEGISSDRLFSEDHGLKCDYNLQMHKQPKNWDNQNFEMPFDGFRVPDICTPNKEKCKIWNLNSDKQASRNSESHSKWVDDNKFVEHTLICPKFGTLDLCKIKRTRRKMNSKQKKKLRSAEKAFKNLDDEISKNNLDDEMLKLKENHKSSKDLEQAQDLNELQKFMSCRLQETTQSLFMNCGLPEDKICKPSKETFLTSPFTHKLKKMQKDACYHLKKMKHMEKVIGKLKDYILADKLNSVIKDLTAVNITDEVKANAFKKKPTQTHLKPV